ncbi:Holliday junction resolvase RuvX [Leucobacter sp. W1153]|uniref:Holliday junction resolvase RuvX n=1 Tax=Leucobacter sp. W1153 TaxID=3439064 RepID=UPI003F2D7A3D
MRTGVRLGIDVGKARIGVARCDLHGMLATPLETVLRDEAGASDVARILDLACEYDAMEVVCGLPLNMRGDRTPSTEDAVHFASSLATALQDSGRAPHVSVRLVDERLSTVSAHGQMRQVGRTTKQSRQIIDQAAAVVILQHALDSERAQGRAPGSTVEPVRDTTVITEQDTGNGGVHR